MNRTTMLMLAAMLAATPAAAQVTPASPATPPTPVAPPQRPQVNSPVVQGDTVTFAIYAPKSSEVILSSGEIERLVPGRNKPFAKADNGVWTLNVSPLPPGIYEYALVVDGVSMADPSSMNVVGNVRGARGFVEVPGPAGSPRPDEWRAGAHGTLTQHFYDSKATQTRRSVHVYTPPGYGATTKKLPVLYLLHGSGDNDAHWAALGRANVIADNLLAAGAMTPMVIVMTDGHAYRPQPGEQGGREKAAKMFEDDLLTEVVPLVEKSYRVETTRDRRAIAGLSMGGGQSLNVGLGHTDRFAWIGAFSSSTGGVDAKVEALAKNAAAFNKGSRLLWLRIGKDDFLLQQNRALIESLKKAGIVHQYEEVEGAHMWGVWRTALADFLPRLFKPAGAVPAAPAPSAAQP
ncbi:MAG: alpha/beta hydrolase-fold protein [Vicinamibacteraceae bacterium]